MKQMGHADARMFFCVDSAAELARRIGGDACAVSEEPYYRHIDKTGLKPFHEAQHGCVRPLAHGEDGARESERGGRLEVVLRGFGRTGVFVPHLINPVLSPKKNLLEKQQTHVVDHTSEQKRGGYVERRRYDGPLRRVDFGPGSRDACRARHIEREREDEGERLGG